MGKLLTLLALGAGAYALWRSRQTKRCGHCRQQIRAQALTCRHCGQALEKHGAVIEVKAQRL